MENIFGKGDNHILYTKVEASLGSTNKVIFVCHIPTQLRFTN